MTNGLISLFSMLGLFGLSGIVINDSIVLVTSIDDYATERGLIPSIIDGASDRLRPVMLTTLTTVLGMAPLLYEQSQQAEFLKPTVITLVYGLGFGMLLVLLVVPSLVAVQHDVARQVRAMRRGLAAPARAIRWGFVVLWALVAAWFAAKGSERLHAWLYAHPHFGQLLIDWEQQKAVSRKSKVFGEQYTI